MLPLNELADEGRNLSDQKSAMTNRVGNTMGSLEMISPMLRNDGVNSSRYNDINSPQQNMWNPALTQEQF